MTATVTTAGRVGAAIEDELDREIDFVGCGIAGNLDAVGQGGESSVSPTGTAILRNVLIQTLGEKGFAIHVGPREIGGQVVFRNVRVGQWGGIIIANVMILKNLGTIE